MSRVAGGYVHPAGQSRAALERHFNRLLEEAARLAESELAPADFFRELLQRILTGSGAAAGAIWAPTSDGGFRADCAAHLEDLGLSPAEPHLELLRKTVERGRPLALRPEGAVDGAANPTDFLACLAPVVMERETLR